MAQQNINIGSSANKGDGDPLRTAFDKINDNFDELYIKVDDASGVITTGTINVATLSASAKFVVPVLATGDYTGNATLEVNGSIVYDSVLNNYYGYSTATSGWKQLS